MRAELAISPNLSRVLQNAALVFRGHVMLLIVRKVVILRGFTNRWILCWAEQPFFFAWGGTHFVAHNAGMSHASEIDSFATREEAESHARACGLVVENPGVRQ